MIYDWLNGTPASSSFPKGMGLADARTGTPILCLYYDTETQECCRLLQDFDGAILVYSGPPGPRPDLFPFLHQEGMWEGGQTMAVWEKRELRLVPKEGPWRPHQVRILPPDALRIEKKDKPAYVHSSLDTTTFQPEPENVEVHDT